MVKLKGPWFKGNVFRFSVAKLVAAKRFERGVKKPTALETKKIRGKSFSRFIFKPIRSGELD